MEKAVLRKHLLGKLAALSNEQLNDVGLKLTHQLVKFLHTFPELMDQIGAGYLPLKAEVAPIYQELWHQVPVTLSFPVLEGSEMKFGIPQGLPRGSTWMEPPFVQVDPEWIMVPGVGFDLNGARLGRGKGYFDRFLEFHKAVRIGLAWSQQIVSEIPVEAHDCRMDFLITEEFCWDVAQQKKF